MLVVTKYIRLYYYYLCIFVFKNNFLKNSYTELVPLYKLVFNYLMRSNLLCKKKVFSKNRYKSIKLIKLVNLINEFKKQATNAYKILYNRYIIFSRLFKFFHGYRYSITRFIMVYKILCGRQSSVSPVRTDFIGMQYILGYVGFIRTYPAHDCDRTLLCQYTYILSGSALNFYKSMREFSYVTSYYLLLVNKYYMYELYENSNTFLYGKSYLFYILLYIGLQYNRKTSLFYSRFYSTMLQYNHLLSDLRLVKPFKKIILRKRKKRKPRDFSKDTFFKCVSGKFNNYLLRVHILFKSTKSNSRITILLNNIVICRLSCGSLGYRKSNRSTYLAANQLGFMVSKTIRRLLLRYLSTKYGANMLNRKRKKTISVNKNYKPALNERRLRFNKLKLIAKEDVLSNCSDTNFFIGNKIYKYRYLYKLHKLNKYLQSVKMQDIYHRRVDLNNIRTRLAHVNSFFPNLQICVNYTGSGMGRKASFKPINSGLHWLKRNINYMRWKMSNSRLYSSRKLLRKYRQKISPKFNYERKDIISIYKRHDTLAELTRLNIYRSNIIKQYLLQNIDYFEYYLVNYIVSRFFTSSSASYILSNLVYYSVRKDQIQYLDNLLLSFDLIYFNKTNYSYIYYISQSKYLCLIYLILITVFDLNFCFILFEIFLKMTVVTRSTLLLFSIFYFIMHLFNCLSKILSSYLSFKNYTASIYFVSEYFYSYFYYNIYCNEVINLLTRLRCTISKLLKNNLLLIRQLTIFVQRNISLSFRLATCFLYKKDLLSSARTNKFFYSFFIPLQIYNYIHLSAKNISRPHNGCRPRKLRRK